MATRATMKAMPETSEARKEPMKPAPKARRNDMNIMPQATGWRIITRVRPLVVSSAAVEKSVLSTWEMMWAGL